MALPTAILVFVGTFGLVLAAVWIARMVMERRGADPAPVEDVEEDPEVAAALFGEESPLLRRGVEVSSISILAWALQRIDFVKQLRHTLSQAGLDWSVGRVTSSMLLLAATSYATLGMIHWLPWWAKVVIALMAGSIPHFYIVGKRNKRWRVMEEQLPDALESLARATRAGHPFSSALDSTANQTPSPLGRELRITYTEGAFGVTWDAALNNLCERLPMEEVCMFASAIQMQSKAGGNLSEVLEKLAENMRESSAIRGEVKSLSAQGRAAGAILSLLPFVICGVLLYVNPTSLNPLLERDIGRTLLACAFIGLVAAHLIIRKLVDIRL
ncbi:MAG: type II secretion system F family protein [Acidobacteria bacterium]|nr:type II secretion system F family protein [Acidobacteriota bacterium]